jgi:hypothetical protein
MLHWSHAHALQKFRKMVLVDPLAYLIQIQLSLHLVVGATVT